MDSEVDQPTSIAQSVEFTREQVHEIVAPYLGACEESSTAIDAAIDAFELMLEADTISAADPLGCLVLMARAFQNRIQSLQCQSQPTSEQHSPKTPDTSGRRFSWSNF